MLVLEQLCYVIEALAEDLPNEARRELGALIVLVRDSGQVRTEIRHIVLEGLCQAEQQLAGPNRSIREVAITLSGVSRRLWKRMLV